MLTASHLAQNDDVRPVDAERRTWTTQSFHDYCKLHNTATPLLAANFFNRACNKLQHVDLYYRQRAHSARPCLVAGHDLYEFLFCFCWLLAALITRAVGIIVGNLLALAAVLINSMAGARYHSE